MGVRDAETCIAMNLVLICLEANLFLLCICMRSKLFAAFEELQSHRYVPILSEYIEPWSSDLIYLLYAAGLDHGRSVSFCMTGKRCFDSSVSGALPGRSTTTVYTFACVAASASVCGK